MSKLQIKTRLNSVVLCGEFCDWDISKSIRIDRAKGAKYIAYNEMPRGEFKVFSCESYMGSEVYPTDGRPMANRYFDGTADETITVFFEINAKEA